MKREAIELRCFDPPFLGIPGRAHHIGQGELDGQFVEIFLVEHDGVIQDIGFLTNIGGLGLACASLWCELALHKHPSSAFAITPTDLLICFPDEMQSPALWDVAELCVRAGQAALKVMIASIAQKESDSAVMAGTVPEQTTQTEYRQS